MPRKIRILPLIFSVLVLAAVALSSHNSIKVMYSAPADTTFAVNDQTDLVDSSIGDGVCLATNGKCTLRAAIQEANAQYAAHPGTTYTITVPAAITFFSPPRLYSLTLTGSGEDNATTGDLDIKANLVIRTNGLPARVSASGLSDRVFDIIQPTTRTISVTLSNIWMSNGTAIDYGGGMRIGSGPHVTLNSLLILTNTVTGQFAQGGGIYAGSGGTLTLNNVLVRANHVQGSNNGSARGGGIASGGKLILNASTVLSNVVTSSAPTDLISGYGGGIDIGCCPGTLDIHDSTIFGNSIVLGSAAEFVTGGGINGGGSVTVTRSTISGNSLSATGSNATVIEGGGLYVNGRLNVLTSTVSNNNVLAAIPSLGMHGGGVVFNFHAQIISSTISFNSVRVGSAPAGYGGGISVGGFYYNADLLLDRSILLSNSANDGGGINSDISTTMVVRNSALEGNLATNGAGIFNLGVLSATNETFYFNVATKSGGGIYNSQVANIDSATFNNDKADFDGDNIGDGGGIFVANGATQYLRNSLLTGNVDDTASGPVLPDCAGTIISQNYNLFKQSSSPTGCNIIGSTSHDLHGTFPGVLDSAAQYNGGPTPTIALPPGSAAINAGDPTGCKDENGNPLTTDQRGYPRVGPCDIGAYEFALRGFLPLVLKNK